MYSEPMATTSYGILYAFYISSEAHLYKNSKFDTCSRYLLCTKYVHVCARLASKEQQHFAAFHCFISTVKTGNHP